MLNLTVTQVAELNAAADAIEAVFGSPVQGLSFKLGVWQVTRIPGHRGWRVEEARLNAYSNGDCEMIVPLNF